MRVTIEATSAYDLRRAGGIARYIQSLLAALLRLAKEHETGDAYALAYRLSRRWKTGRPLDVPDCRTAWIVGSRPFGSGHADVFHGPDARVAPRGGRVLVATVHDVFSLRFDDFASERFRERRRRDYLELSRRCHRLIADSETTRHDFLAHHDYPPDRVDVVPLGVDPRFRPRDPEEIDRARARHGLEGPYLFFVGELSRRKNVARLLAAFARSGLASDFTLAIGGAPSFGYEDIEAARASCGLGERARFLGRVSDEDLPALYAGAEAFVFPTLYEGFGLPVLEAAACGTRVLSSSVGSVPEIAPRSAVLVDPTSEGAIEDGLRRVVELDPAAADTDRAHAARFTWERCARRTRDSWLHAVGSPPPKSCDAVGRRLVRS